MSKRRCCAKKTCPSPPRGECASGKSAGREKPNLSGNSRTVEHLSADVRRGRAGQKARLAPRGGSRLVKESLRFYAENMSTIALPGGVVHDLPEDLARALLASTTAQAVWEDITPLARNEFICWVEDAKRQQTRERRIRRTVEELDDGMRRPCCWPGCSHRERSARKWPREHHSYTHWFSTRPPGTGRQPLAPLAVAALRTGLIRAAAELLQEFVARMRAIGILSHHPFEELSDLVFACVARVAHVLAVVVAGFQRVVLHRDEIERNVVEAGFSGCHRHHSPSSPRNFFPTRNVVIRCLPTVWHREIQKKRVEIRRRINYPPEPGRRPAEGLGREVVSPQPRGRPPPGCSAPPTPRLPCAYRGPRRRAFPELRPAS